MEALLQSARGRDGYDSALVDARGLRAELERGVGQFRARTDALVKQMNKLQSRLQKAGPSVQAVDELRQSQIQVGHNSASECPKCDVHCAVECCHMQTLLGQHLMEEIKNAFFLQFEKAARKRFYDSSGGLDYCPTAGLLYRWKQRRCSWMSLKRALMNCAIWRDIWQGRTRPMNQQSCLRCESPIIR